MESLDAKNKTPPKLFTKDIEQEESDLNVDLDLGQFTTK